MKKHRRKSVVENILEDRGNLIMRGDKVKGETKNWRRLVHSGVIKQAVKKGVKEITSKGGFTGPAIELAKKKKIKLIHRNKPLT